MRITALRAARGPAVELLEYLTPGDGRPFPADTRASDLWHWQVNLTTPDVDEADHLVRQGHYRLVSPGGVDLPDQTLSFAAALMARDPDGHAVLFFED